MDKKEFDMSCKLNSNIPSMFRVRPQKQATAKLSINRIPELSENQKPIKLNVIELGLTLLSAAFAWAFV